MLNRKERKEELMTLPKDVIINMLFELEDELEEREEECENLEKKQAETKEELNSIFDKLCEILSN